MFFFARSEQSSNLECMVNDKVKAFKVVAPSVFGKPNDQLRKPWISASTWSLFSLAAPFRRSAHRISPDHTCYHLEEARLAWTTLLHIIFARCGCESGVIDGSSNYGSKNITFDRTVYWDRAYAQLEQTVNFWVDGMACCGSFRCQTRYLHCIHAIRRCCHQLPAET